MCGLYLHTVLDTETHGRALERVCLARIRDPHLALGQILVQSRRIPWISIQRTPRIALSKCTITFFFFFLFKKKKIFSKRNPFFFIWFFLFFFAFVLCESQINARQSNRIEKSLFYFFSLPVTFLERTPRKYTMYEWKGQVRSWLCSTSFIIFTTSQLQILY